MFTQNMIDLLWDIHAQNGYRLWLGNLINPVTVKDISGNDVQIMGFYSYIYSSYYHATSSLAWARTLLNDTATCRIASMYKLLTDTTEYHMQTSSTSYLNTGVILGTSNEATTINDYCLKGTLINTFKATTNVIRNLTDYGAELLGVYGITNTGTENISIGEMGLVMESESGTKVLLDRTTLTSPLVIAPNEMKTLIYSIRLGGTNIPSGN